MALERRYLLDYYSRFVLQLNDASVFGHSTFDDAHPKKKNTRTCRTDAIWSSHWIIGYLGIIGFILSSSMPQMYCIMDGRIVSFG